MERSVAVDWLTADEEWPKHPRKEAAGALDRARQQGFQFASASSHAFGRLRCVQHTPACELVIFTTAAGDKSGAMTAKIIGDKLRSCRNKEPSSTPGVLDEPSLLLTRAERLMDAADRLRASEHFQIHSDDRLGRALAASSDNTAEGLMKEAAEADSRAAFESRAAWVEACRFGVGDPWPPEDGAKELEREVRTQLESLRVVIDSTDEQSLRDRFNDVNERLQTRE